jgi:hypothetical protein
MPVTPADDLDKATSPTTNSRRCQRQLERYDASIIAELQLGSGNGRQRRIDALLRFTRKLDDAERLTPNAPWDAMRDDLLRAAGSFLVAVDKAIEEVGMQPMESWPALKGRMPRSHLIHGVAPSSPDYVDWSDAVLDLFSRRVVGLGARPHRVVEPSTAQRARRRGRPGARSGGARRQ